MQQSLTRIWKTGLCTIECAARHCSGKCIKWSPLNLCVLSLSVCVGTTQSWLVLNGGALWHAPFQKPSHIFFFLQLSTFNIQSGGCPGPLSSFGFYSYLFPCCVPVCGEALSSLRCSSATVQQQLSETVITQTALQLPLWPDLQVGDYTQSTTGLWPVDQRDPNWLTSQDTRRDERIARLLHTHRRKKTEDNRSAPKQNVSSDNDTINCSHNITPESQINIKPLTQLSNTLLITNCHFLLGGVGVGFTVSLSISVHVNLTVIAWNGLGEYFGF